MATVNLNLRIPDELRERFYKRCERAGQVPSHIIRRMITDYCRGNIRYSAVQKGNTAS